MKWTIPERVIDRARQYVDNGRVLSLAADYEQKVWQAEVLGSELYHVTLDGTPKENDQCECPYWREHHYCKHTVAVELALRKDGLNRVMNQNSLQKTQATLPAKTLDLGKMFTEGLRQLPNHSESQALEKLQVSYLVETIETNQYYPEYALLAVRLKIGLAGADSKSYVIKQLGDFFKSYQKQTTFFVNKTQAFYLAAAAFSDSDQALLAQLQGIFETNQLLGQEGVLVKGKLDKRYVLLPLPEAQSLIEKMTQTGRLQFAAGPEVFSQLTFQTQGLPPLTFQVDYTPLAEYQLTVTEPTSYFYAHYRWFISQSVIYVLTADQAQIYLTLKKLLKWVAQPIIPYQAQALTDLFRVVLPTLEKIGTVSIAPAVKARVLIEPLKTVFSFRRRQGQIDLRVDYHYGPYCISTDEAKTQLPDTDRVLVRDAEQEAAIQQLVQRYYYQKGAQSYHKSLPTGAELYRFFTQELQAFRRYGTVQMGKKLRSLYLDTKSHRPLIEVSQSASWLDVRFDISGIEETEIHAVLDSLLKQEAFYTLESGAVLSLESEDFQETSEVLQKLRHYLDQCSDVVQVPKNKSLMVEAILAPKQQSQFADSFKQLVSDLKEPEQFETVVPTGLQATLRSYQLTGFKWLKMLSHYQFGGILADEMGLGKTLQMITYLLSEKETQNAFAPALVVAPASLIYNWQAEIAKFAPALTVQVVTGNKRERTQALQQPADIYVTSYAAVRQDLENYQAQSLRYLILDEAQMVKNSGSKTAQALRQLAVLQRFALSGTPIENNLDELWSIFQLILPGLLPSKQAFRNLALEEVAKIIQPFILRRDKATVLADLPEKIETNLYSPLTAEQKKVYLAYLTQMQNDLRQMDQETFKKNRLSILAGLTRLRQICCDPHLFLEDYTGSSGKLEQAKDLLLTAKENQRRVLVFSQFTGMLSILERELADLGLTTFYLRGSTKPADRLAMVDAFNAGERDVFLISLKAGGTGLNLTGADTVILYDLWWNPAVEEQATSRAHRMGQKKVVEVWRLIAEGTIEEKMDALQQEKQALFQKVIQGGDEALKRLTEADLRMILNVGQADDPEISFS